MEKIKLNPIDIRTTEGRENYINIFKRFDSKNKISRFTTKVFEEKDGRITVQYQIITKYRDITFDCYYTYVSEEEIQNCILNNDVLDLRYCYIKNLDISSINKKLFINADFAFLDGYTFLTNLLIQSISLYHCTFGEGNKDFTKCKYFDDTVDFRNLKFASGLIDFSDSSFGKSNLLFSDFFLGSGDAIFENCDFENNYVDFKNLVLKKGDLIFRNCIYNGNLLSFNSSFFGVGEIDFSGSVFKNCEIDFSLCTFATDNVKFDDVNFGKGSVFFTETNFSDTAVSFCNSKANSIRFYKNNFKSNVNMHFKKINSIEIINCNFQKALSITTKEEKITKLSLYKSIFNNQLWIDSENCLHSIPKYYKSFYNKFKNVDIDEFKKDKYEYYQYYVEQIYKIHNNSKESVHNNISNDFKTIMSKYKSQGLYDDLDKIYIEYSENNTKVSKYKSQSSLFRAFTKLSKHISNYGTDPVRAIRFAIGNLLLFSCIYFFMTQDNISFNLFNSFISLLYIVFIGVFTELLSKKTISKSIVKFFIIIYQLFSIDITKENVYKFAYAMICLLSLFLFIFDGQSFLNAFILSFETAFSFKMVNEFITILPNNFQLLIPVFEKTFAIIINIFIFVSVVRKYQK